MKGLWARPSQLLVLSVQQTTRPSLFPPLAQPSRAKEAQPLVWANDRSFKNQEDLWSCFWVTPCSARGSPSVGLGGKDRFLGSTPRELPSGKMKGPPPLKSHHQSPQSRGVRHGLGQGPTGICGEPGQGWPLASAQLRKNKRSWGPGEGSAWLG